MNDHTTILRAIVASYLISAMAGMASMRVIDSHLHTWSNSETADSFPFVQDPPDTLRDKADVDSLLNEMRQKGIDGALIVQPINYKYDHSYVLHAIKEHPAFKGMLLYDPSDKDPVSRLEELCLQGFVGVRFNPYLWPSDECMSQGNGLKVYQRCGELNMPVGIMCFQGLQLHYDDIIKLLTLCPDTPCILDHFGFTNINDKSTFEQLLSLAKFPQVHVKISALFRLGDSYPYEEIRQRRFLPLLEAFGSERLLYGSDFPYVLEQPGGYAISDLVMSWIATDQDRANIMSRTAERLFGKWGS
jgi:predicted TIM-barrel fold metal-dependent hydrolase